MKKSIMKRSLILGSLMAFVITGSAMAKDYTGIFQGNLNINEKEAINITNGSLGFAGTVIAPEITINSPSNGIEGCGNLKVDVAGNITISAANNAIFMMPESDGTKKDDVLTINAKNIIIEKAAWGISPKFGGMNITAEENLVINAANGITNSSTQDINIKANNLSMNTTEVYGISAGSKNVNIDVANDVVIKNTGTKGALHAQGGNINIKNNGKTVVEGNIIATKGEANIGFKGEQSYLTGKIETSGTGVTNIEMNGAKWNVTGNSTVSNLTGTGADIIVDSADTTVTIKNNENKGVNVESTGELSDANANNIQGMMDKLAGNVKVESGVTDKTVTAGEGLIVGETSAKYEGDKMVAGSLVEKVNTVNGAISDAGAIGLMTWRNEMNDMNKRMGELRGNEAEHGVWVRMINGELEYAGLENDTKSYQLGYDEKLSTDPRWTVGVSLNYTEGDTTGDKVSAENDHKGFAVYGSKLNEDGSYLDLIAKYARLDHEFTVRDGAKGEWNANGYSVSAEYGKRFTQESGLWYEPQIELTYGTVGAADYVVGGRYVEQDKMDSLVGRVGFRIGKDTSKGNVYARASYLYDFDGESSVTFSDGAKANRTIEQDLGGGWFEVGVGANYKLSDATNLYLDVEKTFGGEVDVNWQWNAGVRYSF